MKGRTIKISRGKTNVLTDQNGYKYRNAKGNYDADSILFDFECDKFESQKCMAKLRYNEVTMEGILITSHSCRWSYEEIPEYRQDNIYIKRGYHPTTITWSEKLYLLFSLHTETINIWSHMVGIFLFSMYLMDSLINGDADYYWIGIIFDLGALFMFTTSVAYHWLHICSENSYNKFLCLDHCGIEVTTFTKHMTWVYYGLFDDDRLFYLCFFIQTIIFALGIIVTYRGAYSYFYRSVDWKFNERIRIGLICACLLYTSDAADE